MESAVGSLDAAGGTVTLGWRPKVIIAFCAFNMASVRLGSGSAVWVHGFSQGWAVGSADTDQSFAGWFGARPIYGGGSRRRSEVIVETGALAGTNMGFGSPFASVTSSPWRMAITNFSATGFTYEVIEDGFHTHFSDKNQRVEYLALGGDDLRVYQGPTPSLSQGTHQIRGLDFAPTAALFLAGYNDRYRVTGSYSGNLLQYTQGMLSSDRGAVVAYGTHEQSSGWVFYRRTTPFALFGFDSSGTLLRHSVVYEVSDAELLADGMRWTSPGGAPDAAVARCLLLGGVAADLLEHQLPVPGMETIDVFAGAALTPDAVIALSGSSSTAPPSHQYQGYTNLGAAANDGADERFVWARTYDLGFRFTNGILWANGAYQITDFGDEAIDATAASGIDPHYVSLLALATLSPLAVITGVSAVPNDAATPASIDLAWDAPVVGAATLVRYNVYRRRAGETAYDRIATSPSTRTLRDYGVASDQPYEYTVTWTGTLLTFTLESAPQATPAGATVVYAGTFLRTLDDPPTVIDLAITRLRSSDQQEITYLEVRGRGVPTAQIGERQSGFYEATLTPEPGDARTRWDTLAALQAAQRDSGAVYALHYEGRIIYCQIDRLERRQRAGPHIQRQVLTLREVYQGGS